MFHMKQPYSQLIWLILTYYKMEATTLELLYLFLVNDLLGEYKVISFGFYNTVMQNYHMKWKSKPMQPNGSAL